MAHSAMRRLSARGISLLGAMVLVLGVGSVALAETQPPTDGGESPPAVVVTDPPVEATPTQPPAEEPAPTVPPVEPTTLPSDSPALDEGTESVDEPGITPFVVGTPDGGTAPYVYWVVKDADGNLVPGATFKFEYSQTTRPTGWQTGTNANAIPDCSSSPCPSGDTAASLERDSDGGEFLLEHRGTNRSDTNRILAGSRYRVTPGTAPAGYDWVSTSSVDSNNKTWVGSGNNRTLDFGTFQVRKLQTQPFCSAGYVYGISATGQIRQVAPGGTVTNLGTPASGVSSFNGIGIGSGGETVYAYERSNNQGETGVSRAAIWEYNTTTGQWTSRNHIINSNTSSRTVQFVAGAVNLNTGTYWVGGFSTNGNVFRLWEYNPATNTSTYKGQVNTPGGSTGQGDDGNNGDIAFDAAGNLYIVRGTGTTTTVFPVTASNLAAANGGTIPTTSTPTSFTTMTAVNGAAFDSTGKAFLGSAGILRSYDMPNWSNSSTVVSSGLDSTDLATCSSPPTIVIEKEIIGGRVSSSDQFRMTLHQGNTLLGEATTTGTATGLQGERIGPLPTVRNVALNFAEVAAGTTNLANYASAYQCTVTHTNGTVQSLQQVNGTSGSITIPPTGEAVRCVFRNSPLIANVTINKQVTDALGLNPAARQGWTVGATTTATAGTAAQAPTGATQTTDASGNAIWKVTFGAYADRATVNVSETMQVGYEFLSGECTVTGLSGSTTTTTLTGPDATGLTGIKPGDQVNCTYVNKPKGGTLAITKAFDDSVPAGSGTETVFNGAYSCVLPAGSSTVVASGTWTREGEGLATLTPAEGTPAANQIPAGANCSVTEDQPEGSEGLPNGSWVWGQPTIGANVTIVAGETREVKVTNTTTRVLGSVTWNKVDDTSALLSGSEWSLQGPGTGGATVPITDCVAADAASCAGPDKDPAAGKFQILDLTWGEYTLTETKAPAGFYPIEPLTFTIGAGDNLNKVWGDIENTRVTGPTIPLTGGIGRDAFFLGGFGILVLGVGATVMAQVRNRRREVA